MAGSIAVSVAPGTKPFSWPVGQVESRADDGVHVQAVIAIDVLERAD